MMHSDSISVVVSGETNKFALVTQTRHIAWKDFRFGSKFRTQSLVTKQISVRRPQLTESYPRVMPCCYIIKPVVQSPSQEEPEFNLPIAHHIRIRRPSSFVLAIKILDDLLPVFLLKIQHLKWNPKPKGYAQCILPILRSPAPRFIPTLKENTGNIIASLHKQSRRNRGIYPA